MQGFKGFFGNMKKMRLFLVLLFLFPGSFSFAQRLGDSLSLPRSVWVIQPQEHIGTLVKIYSTFPSSEFTALNEIRISKQTTGGKEWHQLYHYPQVGFSFIYGYLGNTTILGQNFAVIPDLSFETHSNKRWMFQTRFGFGFSYFTKHYNAIDNPTNNVIGASITAMTFISGDLNYKLSKSLNINLGISAFHCSDGHYQLPNLGANIPSVNVGVSYFIKPVPTFYHHDSVAEPNKKVLLNIFAGYGRHEFGSATKPTDGPKYPVFQGGIYISKRLGRIHNFQTGVSYTYFTDYYDFIVNEEYFDSQQHLKASVVTAFIGDEFMIGKFGLLAQSGVNVYTPFLTKYMASRNDKDPLSLYITNKIGVQYYIFDPTLHPRKNMYVGLYMKAHFGTADFAEVGLGYTF